MSVKPKIWVELVCPDKDGDIGDAHPLWEVMAMPFHLMNKTCSRCGKPAASHGLRIELKKKRRRG